jgi:cytochrome c oxidase subunit 3/cytochrome o ubiquinol oxidase subunit 3
VTTTQTPPTTETPAGPGLVTDDEGQGHPATSTGISNEKVGMWAFLGSECLLFGALISTYFLYRGRLGSGAVRPGQIYDIPFTSVSSFILLMSSLTMVLALAGFQRGDLRRGRIWLLCTALLGSGFIGGQVYEFTIFIHRGMTLKTNPASSAFYVLTGFHGTHVAIGVLMLLVLFFMSLRGRIGQEKSEVIEIIGLYWHFVDVVWIVVFTVVYLLPGNR